MEIKTEYIEANSKIDFCLQYIREFEDLAREIKKNSSRN